MNGPFCQSCGMPICTDDLWGTEKNGKPSQDYCQYCYQEGVFTQPDVSMDQMMEICIPFMEQSGMAKDEAKQILEAALPKLKRWQNR